MTIQLVEYGSPIEVKNVVSFASGPLLKDDGFAVLCRTADGSAQMFFVDNGTFLVNGDSKP